jgi:hypothetical protein
MYGFKRGRLVTVALVSLVLGAFVFGCATNARVNALEADTQKALEQSGQALQEAQSVKAMAGDSARYSSEAAASAQRAEDAATRAENAARMCEEIYNRIMSK